MHYSEATQRAITFIEERLTEECRLAELPCAAGYSKYHLLRIFKQETGKSIGEYIRTRRLATAAAWLLHTDESILTIAFLFQFQSQEAFTRAFKEQYSLPPGKYRKWMKDIRMEEKEKMKTTEQVAGWSLSGSNPELYELTLDTTVFHTGTGSGLLHGRKEANEQQFGTMMQGFQAKEFKGKRLKLFCYLKTEDAFKCGAWMRVDNSAGDSLQFDNMDSRSISGTTDWNYYMIVLDVPEESESIHFGVLLIGSGSVWADGFCFDIVDEKTAVTNMLQENLLPEQPVNLDFSE